LASRVTRELISVSKIDSYVQLDGL